MTTKYIVNNVLTSGQTITSDLTIGGILNTKSIIGAGILQINRTIPQGEGIITGGIYVDVNGGNWIGGSDEGNFISKIKNNTNFSDGGSSGPKIGLETRVYGNTEDPLNGEFTVFSDYERNKLRYNLKNVPNYTDNADALVNGLYVGDIYRNNSGVLCITY